jgi:hypothetical protein
MTQIPNTFPWRRDRGGGRGEREGGRNSVLLLQSSSLSGKIYFFLF